MNQIRSNSNLSSIVASFKDNAYAISLVMMVMICKKGKSHTYPSNFVLKVIQR